jgi:osmoprotectant transport system substrate-binding protein
MSLYKPLLLKSPQRGRTSLVLVALLSVIFLLSSCGNDTASSPTPSQTTKASGPPVIIGSKFFTENVVVAEIYAQKLESAGIPVVRKLRSGPTDVNQPAILKGDLSLYPEYTGTALEVILKLPRESNAIGAAYKRIVQEYPARYHLVMLEPAPMNNTYALAVTAETAAKYNLKTLSDLAPKASTFDFVSIAEWDTTRTGSDGLKNFQAAYNGYNFKQLVEVAEADRYTTLQKDPNPDKVVLAYTTDGQIAGDHLVLLTDDKQFFPAYQVAPVVREDILTRYPNIQPLLNAVSAKLTTANITAMNWKIDGPEKQDVAAVAKDFLNSEGLLP